MKYDLIALDLNQLLSGWENPWGVLHFFGKCFILFLIQNAE